MFNSKRLEKIIGLWALSEAFLGGLLHALKMPFTGLIIGNTAVILITLIARFSDKKGTILKATLIVIIIKGMISPHTPLTAYFAVFIQGLLGELFFYRNNFPAVSALFLGVITSLLSAFQKIILLTLVFGNNLWVSINEFFNFLIIHRYLCRQII